MTDSQIGYLYQNAKEGRDKREGIYYVSDVVIDNKTAVVFILKPERLVVSVLGRSPYD